MNIQRLFTFLLLLAGTAAFAAAQENTYQRYLDLTRQAPRTFARGDAKTAAAEARELLSLAKGQENDWNYGNAIHVGHLVLGRVAVAENRIKDAKTELLASVSESALPYGLKAVAADGAHVDRRGWKASPVMDSFGPDMSLARAMLLKGETDVVAQYFDLCRRFWKMEDGRLKQWNDEIREKKIPAFGPNLVYFFTLEPVDSPMTAQQRIIY